MPGRSGPSAQQWQCPGTYIYDSNPNGWQYGDWYTNTNAVQIGGPEGPNWPKLGAPPWQTTPGKDAGAPFGVSQPFALSSAATVSCLEFLVWEYPFSPSNESISTLYWSLDSTAFGVGSGNTHYGGGTAHTGAQLQQEGPVCANNEYGYKVCVVSIALPPGGLKLNAGSYYLTLTLGTELTGYPLYWDEYLTTGSAVQRPPTGPAGTMTFAIY